MPVSAGYEPNVSAGNGVTTVFPYNFRILEEADLLVQIDGVEQTSGYTVSGVGNPTGGSVTFTSAPSNGVEIVIARDVAYNRETDYQANGDLLEETLDADLDRIVMQVQQLKELLARTPSLALGSALAGLISLPAPEALAYLRWNAAAANLENADAVYDLGDFLQSGTGAVSRTAAAKIAERFSPPDFGAVGDGTDEAAELQLAITAAAGSVLDLLGRTYRADTGLTVPSGTTIQNGVIDFSNAPASAKLFTAAGTLLGNTGISGASRGAASFTVTSATGISERGWYFLRSTDAFGAGGTYRGEWVRCKTLVGTAFTPYGRLDDTYTTSPNLYRYALAENITLRNLRLIGRGNGYAQYAGQFSYARNVHIYDVEAEFFGDRAFEFIRCLDCSVTTSQMGHGDHATGLSYGIVVANGCVRITVGHSTFLDVRHAVTVGGEDGVDRYVTVTGCAVADCTDSGLDSHPQSQYVAFVGNTIGADGTTASQDGIVVQGANQTVVGNTVQGFERSGILVQNLVTDSAITDNNVVVSGNVVTRPVGSGPIYGIALENQGTVDGWRFSITGNTVDVVNVTESYGVSVENLGATITGGAISGNTVYSRREALTLKTATNKVMRSIAVSGNSLETVDTTTYDVISIQAGSTPNYLERVIIVGNSIYGGRYGINNSQGTRIKPDANMIQGFGTGGTNGTFVGTNDNYSS